ncbi:MAG: recombinase family protein [Clostridia bacterium]|nr:recombinase family protein [Clostridia bacterium]
MQFNGGNAPLGYKIVDKHYEIDEAEAVIVRKIFTMASEGYSYNDIIHELNRCGYKTKTGKPFGKNSLYEILKNPRYKGTYIFNRRAKRTSKNTRNNHKYKPEEEQIIIEDGVPAIVSKELWEKANAARKYMAKTSTNARHKYLLSGLLYCGECGGKMHGNYRIRDSHNYTTYRCNKQATRLDCKSREIRAEPLESFVINALCEHFFDPENIDIITDELNRKLRVEMDADREEIKAAHYSIAGLKTARNNLVDAIAEHGFSSILSKKLKDIEEQIERYEKMISDDEGKTGGVRITREEVVQRIEKLRECMKNPDNIDQTKILLHQYIDRIEINNTKIKVVFKTTFSVFIDDIEYVASYGFEAETTRRDMLARWDVKER